MVFLEAPELSRKDLQLLPADLMVLLIKRADTTPCFCNTACLASHTDHRALLWRLG